VIRLSSGAANELHSALPQELLRAIGEVYEPAGMKITQPATREAESAEYGACRLELDGSPIVFRVAKTTPTKLGQFVTVWKRPTPASEIAPFDSSDQVAFVVVAVSDASRRGQFVFSRRVLVEKGILSRAGKGGKRAIRVYPPWVTPAASAALATQKWQLESFLSLESNPSATAAEARRLFKATPTPP
jgi:hypothetical protein